MNICVLGTGYVGLVCGAGFAEMGNSVVCCDVDADKIARLEKGEVPIFEPGLEVLLKRNIGQGRLTFSLDVAASVARATAVFIAVGTPPKPNGEADLRHIHAAGAAIAPALRRFTVVAVKSTVPVGTADELRRIVATGARVPFAIVSNPEFLKEGDAVNDFMKPARVIVGTEDRRAREVLRRLYAPFLRTADRLIFMDNRSAELTKYATNALLATRISFMNEIAGLCERIGADVDLVRRGVGSDPRIGAMFLFPGPGFGGSCFPKDLRALWATAETAGATLEVVPAVLRVNERQKSRIVEKILHYFGFDVRGRRIAVWGLAFKPGTDDVRESPALATVDGLLRGGATVAVHDPVALEGARRIYGDRVEYFDDNYECVRGADALALMTEWREFREPDFERIRRAMKTAVLFDARNLWDPEAVRVVGFTYHGIGRRLTIPVSAANRAAIPNLRWRRGSRSSRRRIADTA
jgi:UDPglucose 6-dehydrogenase